MTHRTCTCGAQIRTTHDKCSVCRHAPRRTAPPPDHHDEPHIVWERDHTGILRGTVIHEPDPDTTWVALGRTAGAA